MTHCVCTHDRQSHEVSENFTHPCHECECEDYRRAQDEMTFWGAARWVPENVDVKGGRL